MQFLLDLKFFLILNLTNRDEIPLLGGEPPFVKFKSHNVASTDQSLQPYLQQASLNIKSENFGFLCNPQSLQVFLLNAESQSLIF